MEEQILRRIKIDIRNNFGKVINWNCLKVTHYNCFMFAVGNTIPTEIFVCRENGIACLESLIGADVAYFGNIGQISGKNQYKSIEELIEALKSDLETLGFCIEESFLEQRIETGTIKIAFYYNIKELGKNEYANFHFIKQEENGIWIHKRGWRDGIEQLGKSITDYHVNGLEFVGCFRLTLSDN